MDSTVIQEIAYQLGMAVDQAGQFITEQLPAFAGLKVMQITVGLTTAWVCFLIPAIVSFVALFVAAKHRKSDREHRGEDGYKPYGIYSGCDYSDHEPFWVFVIAGIVAVIVFVIAVSLTAVNLPNAIGWSDYPQAMLIDMALKAVG